MTRLYAETADPWLTERRRCTGALMRIIDLDKGTQAFLPVPAKRNATAEDFEREAMLDGCTLIKCEHGLEHEERLAVIQRFDRLWHENERQQQEEAARRRAVFHSGDGAD